MVPVHAGRNKIQNDFIQQRVFFASAQPYQYIISICFKFIVTRPVFTVIMFLYKRNVGRNVGLWHSTAIENVS